MSLHYIIDGYNITNHPRFTHNNSSATALVEFIVENKLCGSSRNTVAVVFDGYPDKSYEQADTGVKVVFSREDSADGRIKEILETSGVAASTVVVSDDKEIKFFAKACGAKAISVEEFIPSKEKKQLKNSDLTKPELNYTQMHKINEELKKLWLK